MLANMKFEHPNAKPANKAARRLFVNKFTRRYTPKDVRLKIEVMYKKWATTSFNPHSFQKINSEAGISAVSPNGWISDAGYIPLPIGK